MRPLLALACVLTLAALALPGEAVHFYRGSGGGCSPASGALGAPPSASGARVLVLHNTFADTTTLSPVTVVQAGQSVTWLWASEHCHSARAGTGLTQGTDFNSGFHYPAATPTTPPVLPNLFHYPVPTLEPTLSFTATFDTPGVYNYYCEHHFLIGMEGVVVVV